MRVPALPALIAIVALSVAASAQPIIDGVRGSATADVLAAVNGPTPTSTLTPIDDSTDRLAARALFIPVAGVTRAALHDSFNEQRGLKRHEAIDIAALRGTPVIAVDNGRVVKLFRSMPGGLTVYQFDPEEKFAYYYGHLDGYAEGLKEGMLLERGDLIGYVGTTGNAAANAPHLHFAIFRLEPEKRWWKGAPINPYPLLKDAQ